MKKIQNTVWNFKLKMKRYNPIICFDYNDADMQGWISNAAFQEHLYIPPKGHIQIEFIAIESHLHVLSL